PSDYLRSERDDLHELLAAELTRHGPEDPGADRLVILVDDDGAVGIELDVRTIGPLVLGARPDDDRTSDVTLLHAGLGMRLANGHDDHIAHSRITPPGTAEDLDAIHAFRAAIICDVKYRLGLNHLKPPGAGLEAGQPPSAWFYCAGGKLESLRDRGSYTLPADRGRGNAYASSRTSRRRGSGSGARPRQRRSAWPGLRCLYR